MSRLIMFTDSYPYSNANEWKGFELREFVKRFAEVYVAPLRQKQPHKASDLPSGVKALPPIYPYGFLHRSAMSRTSSLIGPRLLQHAALIESPNFREIRRFLAASADVEHIMRSPAWQQAITPLLPGSHLYFFWGRDYTQILPYLPRELQKHSLVRMHRWDLYTDINDGYIPYQRRIVQYAALTAPISQDGVDKLIEAFPDRAAFIRCLRLGTMLRGLSRPSDDGILRLVSCAYARPVKRLHLIAEALAHVRETVIWSHLGDGPELERVGRIGAALPSNITVRLLGKVAPPDVSAFYEGNACDVFINVSESEGIPVSIMEAMAAGIPAIATDVGGSAELVDESVGQLVPADVTPCELANVISNFAHMQPAAVRALREASRARVASAYDIDRNAKAVAEALLSL